LSDSEFLPVWKKYPGAAGSMIKAKFIVTPAIVLSRRLLQGCFFKMATWLMGGRFALGGKVL
jgi:hypothetical protein